MRHNPIVIINNKPTPVAYEGMSTLFGLSIIAEILPNDIFGQRYYVPTEWVYNPSLVFAVVSGHKFQKLDRI